jgi:hypothetical protein
MSRTASHFSFFLAAAVLTAFLVGSSAAKLHFSTVRALIPAVHSDSAAVPTLAPPQNARTIVVQAESDQADVNVRWEEI